MPDLVRVHAVAAHDMRGGFGVMGTAWTCGRSTFSASEESLAYTTLIQIVFDNPFLFVLRGSGHGVGDAEPVHLVEMFKMVLGNRVSTDVPLTPVVEAVEGLSIVLVAFDVPGVEGDVRHVPEKLPGNAEEIKVRLLGREFVCPEDLAQGTGRVARNGDSSTGRTEEEIGKVDKANDTEEPANLTVIG